MSPNIKLGLEHLRLLLNPKLFPSHRLSCAENLCRNANTKVGQSIQSSPQQHSAAAYGRFVKVVLHGTFGARASSSAGRDGHCSRRALATDWWPANGLCTNGWQISETAHARNAEHAFSVWAQISGFCRQQGASTVQTLAKIWKVSIAQSNSKQKRRIGLQRQAMTRLIVRWVHQGCLRGACSSRRPPWPHVSPVAA